MSVKVKRAALTLALVLGAVIGIYFATTNPAAPSVKPDPGNDGERCCLFSINNRA